MADLSSILRALSGGDKVAPPGTMSRMITGQKPEPSWWDDLNARVDASAPSEIVKRIASEIGGHYNKGDLGSYASGGVDALANGLLMGHGADVRGNVRHALFGEDAGAEASATQGQLDRFATDNPYTSGTAGVAGGVGAFANPATAAVAAGILGRGATDAWGDAISADASDPTRSDKFINAGVQTGFAGLGALPVVGQAVRGASPAVAQIARLLATGGKAATAGGTATGLGLGLDAAMTTDAEAKTKRQAAARPAVSKAIAKALAAPVGPTVQAANAPDPMLAQINGDPKATSLYQQYRELQSRANADVPEVNPASADKVRAKAASDASAIQEQLTARIQEVNASHEPWDVAHPDLAKNWFGIRLAAPLALGALLHRGPPSAWGKAISTAERAMEPNPGGLTGMLRGKAHDNPELATMHAGKAKAMSDGYQPENVISKLLKAGGTTALGAELANIPNQYNAAMAKPGSAEQTYGSEHLFTPELTASGAIGGLAGGILGGELRGRVMGTPEALKSQTAGLLDVLKGKAPTASKMYAKRAADVNARSELTAARQDAAALENAPPPSVEDLRATRLLDDGASKHGIAAETLAPVSTVPGDVPTFGRGPTEPVSPPPPVPLQSSSPAPIAPSNTIDSSISATSDQGMRGLAALIGKPIPEPPLHIKTGMEDIRRALMAAEKPADTFTTGFKGHPGVRKLADPTSNAKEVKAAILRAITDSSRR